MSLGNSLNYERECLSVLADVKMASAIAKLIRMLFWSVSSLCLLIPHKPHEKNVVIFVIVFCIIVQNFTFVFWHPQEVPDLAKSSQNAVKVCKKEGPTFSRKAALSYKNQPKMTSLGTPKESQKSKKCGKRPSQNQPQKNL